MLVNVQARALGLGSGGFDVLYANLTRGLGLAAAEGAHVMKLPYTPLQAAVPHAEEELTGGAFAASLEGMPVVCCSLHSQLAPACAALAGRRVAYVQLEGGALPVSLSDAVRALRDRGLLEVAVAVGACFDGDVACVTPWSALAWAGAQGYDVVVVAIGPGIVGTASPLGHGGVAAATAANAACALGGRPVIAPRRLGSRFARPSSGGLAPHAHGAPTLPRRGAARLARRVRRRPRGRRGGGHLRLARGVRRAAALPHGARAGRRPVVLRGGLRGGQARRWRLTWGQSVAPA